MTVEMSKSPFGVSEEVKEVGLQEPTAIFLVNNGAGEEMEVIMTLSGWRTAVHSSIEDREKIKEGQERVKERGRMVSKRKTSGTGKRYSSAEKKQILSQIERDGKKIDLAMKLNHRWRTILASQGNWLSMSPSQCPLRVRVKYAVEDELISGEPLNGGETAWRMYVLQGWKDLTFHPNVRMVKEFFVLRRDVFLKNEDKPGEAARKLDEFRSRISGIVPDELVPVFRGINQFDFKKPLLPELETLRKES